MVNIYKSLFLFIIQFITIFRFDPWSLLNAFKNKAISLGTFYVEGEVLDFGFKIDESVAVEGDAGKEYEGINSVKVCSFNVIFILRLTLIV